METHARSARKPINICIVLRTLSAFDVSSHIIESVYHSLVESIITFNIILWFGLLTVREKSRLNRIVNMASIQQKQLSVLHTLLLATRKTTFSRIYLSPYHVDCREAYGSCEGLEPLWLCNMYCITI